MATFEEQLVEHRVYLMRFARLQLRNDAWAEDAVSETLLAALSKPQSFGNRSQLKTWLVGILKHKVIDLIRSHAREVSLPDHGADDEADELDKLAFQADGHFASPPGDPDLQFGTAGSVTLLMQCLLPALLRADAPVGG